LKARPTIALSWFLLQQAPRHRNAFLAVFRHLGAIGLFFLAILDSSPVPTLGGPDILVAILVASKRNPWYEYSLVATVGSTIGAYITFRLARRAGEAWLRGKFGGGRATKFLGTFQSHGTGTLIATTAIPFPFPTSLVFAAAGASNYPLPKFLGVVALCRAARYAAVGLLVELYGPHIIRVVTHPTRYLGWLAVFTAVVVILVVGGILLQRKLVAAPAR